MDKKEIANQINVLNSSIVDSLVSLFGRSAENVARLEILEDQAVDGASELVESATSQRWLIQSLMKDLVKMQNLLGKFNAALEQDEVA